MAETNTI